MSNQKKAYDCPVCESSKMEQLSPSEELELILDYCNDCGGMWFDAGEVRQLHLCSPDVLSSRITMKKQLFTVDCPSCGKSMTRNTAECSCGHVNTIDCPSCGSELERVQSESFAIDVCRECRGVWFDNMDLSQVWKLEFNHSDEAKALSKEGDTEDTVLAILRHSSTDADADGSRNVFGTIAGIVGGIFAPTDS